MNYSSTQEKWKKIVQLQNRYEISNQGRIRNATTLKVLKTQISHSGYLRVAIQSEGKNKQYTIHRLVAQYFVSNPSNKPEVNHKDENKLNNKADNLEWVTQKENVNYGTGIARQRVKLFKPIIQLDIHENFLAFYPSLKDASKATGCSSPHICRVARGKRKTTGGYKWKYADFSSDELGGDLNAETI